VSGQRICMEPIGRVVSPVTEPVDEGWGCVVSRIELDPALADGLTGLDGFSHAVIVYWLDRAGAFDPASSLVRHPRERADLPASGIFAQRAKHRPNPLGVTAVEIVAVEGSALVVKGLDAIDGTPVLDVKPYVPAYDVRDAAVPSWIVEIMKGYFE
jgi:tRNA (adenine37-N6)-methyltransferase